MMVVMMHLGLGHVLEAAGDVDIHDQFLYVLNDDGDDAPATQACT